MIAGMYVRKCPRGDLNTRPGAISPDRGNHTGTIAGEWPQVSSRPGQALNGQAASQAGGFQARAAIAWVMPGGDGPRPARCPALSCPIAPRWQPWPRRRGRTHRPVPRGCHGGSAAHLPPPARAARHLQPWPARRSGPAAWYLKIGAAGSRPVRVTTSATVIPT